MKRSESLPNPPRTRSSTLSLFHREKTPFPGIRHHNVDKEIKEKEVKETTHTRRLTKGRSSFLTPVKKSPPTLFADCYEDLAQDVQKRLKDEGISPQEINANWSIAKTIIKFILHKKIYKKEDEQQHVDKPSTQTTELVDYSQEYFCQNRFRDQYGKLFAPENPLSIYKLNRSVGSGGFGKVSSAEDVNKNFVAIKVQPYDTEKNQHLNNHEVSILSFCKHPNICQYITSYLNNQEAWLVVEFLEGGTLSQTVSRHKFVENELCYVAKHLLQAIQYLHENQLVHRDIKSPNVMLTVKGVVKLIDMGICADLSIVPNRKELLGSPLWIPPEMIHQQPHDYKADIWSFAVCMLELTNGQPPNARAPLKAMFDAATRGIINPFPKPEMWSADYRNFIAQHCLIQDPSERASAVELLKHPFISSSERVTKKQMKQMLKSAFQQTMDMFNM